MVSGSAGLVSLGDLRDSLSSVGVWCWPGHGLVNSLHVYGRFDPCHLTPGLLPGYKKSVGLEDVLLVKRIQWKRHISFVHQNLTLGVWLLGLKWDVCLDRSVLNFNLWVKDLSFGEGLIMEKPWICFVVVTFENEHAWPLSERQTIELLRWSAGQCHCWFFFSAAYVVWRLYIYIIFSWNSI